MDFNPQTTETLLFKKQAFRNEQSPQAPFHQLATALGRNSLTLPSIIVLDEKLQTLDVVPFFLNAKTLSQITYYYGDEVFRKKSWSEFISTQTH